MASAHRGQRNDVAERLQPEATQLSDVSPYRLLVRCLVERYGNQWQAFSLEFGLAVQSDSMLEAKRRLDAMIESYVTDALTGEDRKHAYELLTRKATWRVYVRYYKLRTIIYLLAKTGRSKNAATYYEPLPLGLRTA